MLPDANDALECVTKELCETKQNKRKQSIETLKEGNVFYCNDHVLRDILCSFLCGSAVKYDVVYREK